jgi:hypothetical protein
MLQELLFALGGASLLGALGLGVVALFAAGDAEAWRRVAAATSDVAAARVMATAVAGAGGPLRAPHGGAACCWYAVWATETSRGVGTDDRAGGHVAVFERSSAPIVLALDDGTRVALDPERTWIEPGPSQTTYGSEATMPFGASPEHRALAAWPATRSWAQFAARGPVTFRDPPSIGEVWLEPGARVDAYGVATRHAEGTPALAPVPAAGGVVVLRAGGGVAERAVERAAVSASRRRLRTRAAGALAASFLVFAILGGALAG